MLSLVKKSSIKQFVVYCFGLVVKKNGGMARGRGLKERRGLINFTLLKAGGGGGGA